MLNFVSMPFQLALDASRNMRNFVRDEFFGGWSPKVDIEESTDRVTIHAAVPGAEYKDIKINIRDKSLVIKGERMGTSGNGGVYYTKYEQEYGRFKRVCKLPCAVNPDTVETCVKNGILTVEVRKLSAKPKAIKFVCL